MPCWFWISTNFEFIFDLPSLSSPIYGFSPKGSLQNLQTSDLLVEDVEITPMGSLMSLGHLGHQDEELLDLAFLEQQEARGSLSVGGPIATANSVPDFLT